MVFLSRSGVASDISYSNRDNRRKLVASVGKNVGGENR